jgi:hypothetical protein
LFYARYVRRTFMQLNEADGKIIWEATLDICGKRPLPPSRSVSDSTDTGVSPAASTSSKTRKKRKTTGGKDGDIIAIQLLTKMHEDSRAAERRHNELAHELVSAFTKHNERLVDLIAGSGPSARGQRRAEDLQASESDDVEDDEYDEGWRSPTDSI